MNHCYVYYLEGYTLMDALMIMVYCLSASCDGDLKKINWMVSSDAPYILFNASKLNTEVQDLLDAWYAFIDAVSTLPAIIDSLDA